MGSWRRRFVPVSAPKGQGIVWHMARFGQPLHRPGGEVVAAFPACGVEGMTGEALIGSLDARLEDEQFREDPASPMRPGAIECDVDEAARLVRNDPVGLLWDVWGLVSSRGRRSRHRPGGAVLRSGRPGIARIMGAADAVGPAGARPPVGSSGLSGSGNWALASLAWPCGGAPGASPWVPSRALGPGRRACGHGRATRRHRVRGGRATR